MATTEHASSWQNRQTTQRLIWPDRGMALVLLCGLALAGLMFSYAYVARFSEPSILTVDRLATEKTSSGWRVHFEVHNHGAASVSAVEVRGELLQRGQPVEESEVSLDTLVGHAHLKGSLIFTSNPKGKSFKLRAVGMTDHQLP